MSLEMGLKDTPAVRAGRALNSARGGQAPPNPCAHLCKVHVFFASARIFLERWSTALFRSLSQFGRPRAV